MEIAILGVPLDLGAGRRGVDMGPSAIRYAGLNEHLRAIGHAVHDLGNIPVALTQSARDQSLDASGEPRAHDDAEILSMHTSVDHDARHHSHHLSPPRTSDAGDRPSSNIKWLKEVREANISLYEKLLETISDDQFPLVLGGDHSIAIGSLAAHRRHKKRLGVIWFDAHGDVNTPETSPSGNIHGMPLAVALGYGEPSLTAIGDAPYVHPEDIALIGIRDLDPGEKIFLRKLGIRVFTMHDIDRHGMSRVMEEALDFVTRHTDGVHLSFDLDALDPLYAPGVGTPVAGGVSYREAHLAMEMLAEADVITSADFVEVNPILDVENRTARATVRLIGSLLGDTLF
ncbi:MAG: Arginase [Candidatus Carbobacillus altaicus]|uniref:Arginase n=1 Tax=Candidatus Carbonibacillus altaicus TaxID=2163959 RepID=A0A2R6Y3E8_9BACL|nr:MAG: Arginase [Candidatus Carbobacillus altaicus]